ncbi:MAG: CoA-binding protein [Deltaproteobacteria bacterium]|nr:MAG: CoA-binding protein [Deltaproteobacteria bacterium]
MGNRISKERPGGSDLSLFFEPRSIAVIGSLKEGFFGGYVVIKSLLNAGYTGEIFRINPANKVVLGLKVYSSIKEVGAKVDLVIIMINARAVPQVLKECAEKGVKAIILVSDGFAERDQEGARLQNEIVEIAREWGLRIIGPNTAGIVNTANGLNSCPYEAGYYRLKQGPVAICSQSGMSNPQAFSYPNLGMGVSKICDFGNKCDLNECDMLECLEKDPQTEVISMYLEGIQDGRKFLEIAKRVTAKKPVLILKSGRTQEGARASASHTGSMAIDDQVFESACNQAGILRLEEFNELFELPKIFGSQPLPKGNRLGIVSYTGGIGVVALDQGAKYGLAVTKLTSKTWNMLNGIFPGLGMMPVDIGPVAPVFKDFLSLYPKILKAVMADKNVDSVFNVLWADSPGNNTDAYIKAYEDIQGDHRKPLATWIYGPNVRMVAELTERMEDLGFPVFSKPETSIKALGLALKYAQIKERNQGIDANPTQTGYPVGENRVEGY